MIRRAAAAGAIAVALAGAADLRADPATAAATAAQDLSRATRALEAANDAEDRIAALTATIQGIEQGLAALRDGLRNASLREATVRARLDSRSTELGKLLGVLMAIGRGDVISQLVHPAGPLGMTRAGMLLGSVTPALAQRAGRLEAELRELTALRRAREDAAKVIADALDAAQTARAELGLAVAERRDMPRRFIDEQGMLQALAQASDTLESFARALAADPQPPADAPLRDFEQARGTMRPPVLGRVLHPAGQADAAGVRRPGVVLSTAPGALVVAPWSGTVRYVGPLLDYGNVIVLEPAQRYLLILAGLETVYVDVGQIVPEGRALGLVAGEAVGTTGAASGQARSSLYVELRSNEESVDPEAWFAFGVDDS